MEAFPPEFQQEILACIVYSTKFLKSVYERIKPDHFESKEHWVICTLAYEFFDNYEQAPKRSLLQEIAKYVRRTRMNEDAAGLLVVAFDSLEKPKGSTRYVLDEIDKFLKHQSIRSVLEEFIPKYNRGDYDLETFTKNISDIQSKFTQPDKAVDILSGASNRIVTRMVNRRIKPIATLIDPLDAHLVGLEAPRQATIIAPAGTGKSFFLCHLGKAAAMQGHTVFHYTGEMSAEEVISRYDQMMVGTNSDGLLLPGTAKKLMQSTKLLQNRGGRLFVSFFPYPSTTKELRRDIANKIAVHGQPSLFIFDAAERLEPSSPIRSGAKHESIGKVWQELHQISVDFNTPQYATNQGNIGAVGAKRVTELQNAFGYDVIRISDIVLGFNRNMVYNQRTGEWNSIDEEYNPDVIRLFIIKNRGRADKIDIRFACDFDRSQFYSRSATKKMLQELTSSTRGKKKKGSYIGDQAVLDD